MHGHIFPERLEWLLSYMTFQDEHVEVDAADSMEKGEATKKSIPSTHVGRQSPQYVHDMVDEELSPKRVKIESSGEDSQCLGTIEQDLEDAKGIMKANVEKTINRGMQFQELSDRARMNGSHFYP